MADSNSSFEKVRDYAQYFTMAAAIVAGVFWVLSDVISSSDSSTLNIITNIAVGATMAGGIVMGILYLIHLSKKSKAA